MEIKEQQQRVLDCIAKEAGVKAWNFGIVPNPTDPRDLWQWRTDSCRHLPDRHHGGTPATLGKLRKLNKSGSDIYFRPAASDEPESIIKYRYFVLDDVPEASAREIARMNRALVVHTSKEGGCQVWVFTEEGLTPKMRLLVQQHYCRKLGADPGAASGTQYSRMPGCKNYKRGGQWVNVICWPKGQRLSVASILSGEKEGSKSASPVACEKRSIPVLIEQHGTPEAMAAQLRATIERAAGWPGDPTPSGADFRACCAMLAVGCDPDLLVATLASVSQRKGRNADKYAARTVAAATLIISNLG